MSLNIINPFRFLGEDMVWTELINEYDTTAANTLNTSYVDCGSYRVLQIYWSAHLKTGSAALDIRFYNVDESEESASIQGTAGFYNSNTLNQNANQTSYDLTFGNALMNGRDIALEMTLLCASISDDGAGGRYSISQRGSSGESYNVTYCNGNLYQAHNSCTTATDLMYFNGIKDISGNTWENAILTCYGAGVNTS